MNTLELNHEAMKRWNENRAKNEQEGLNKFYALGELWRKEREQKNVSENPPSFCVQKCKTQSALWDIVETCGKPSVAKDTNGRNLCQKHFNKWKKKMKNNEK